MRQERPGLLTTEFVAGLEAAVREKPLLQHAVLVGESHTAAGMFSSANVSAAGRAGVTVAGGANSLWGEAGRRP
ncbi:hypothetical protein [Streptomyces atacamensis]|uniref:hypothetical protein n=1 Tax=Streptomyces atacamensis TaxID=531966 RepID=UPI00399D51DC